RVPGHPVAHRRQRRRARGRALAHAARRVGGREGPRRPPRLLGREALRHEHDEPRRRPRTADPRPHGLHEGAAARALVPRAATPAHLRGHRRDPEAHDRAQPAARPRQGGSVAGMTTTRSLDPMAFFRPKSVALVGATEKSGWSIATYNNLLVNGFDGDIYLVNPRAEEVHGAKAYPSLADIGAPVDLVYVMTPIEIVPEVIRHGVDIGAKNYVVLTAGYGEVGGEGAVREQELLDLATELEVTILGPNGNGFINAADGVTPYGLPIPQPLIAGSVGVVLQSGALASSVLSFAQSRNIGISLLVAMGNETVMSVTDVVRGLVEDPKTKSIALFLESVRRPEEFAEVAKMALDAGKPIVALKIGRSV